MADKDTGIRIMCPKLTCRKILAMPATARGKTVRCKACGTAIRVPVAKKSEDGTNPRQAG